MSVLHKLMPEYIIGYQYLSFLQCLIRSIRNQYCLHHSHQSTVPKSFKMASTKTISDINAKGITMDEWDTLFDAQLVAVVSYKLEQLLTELLSRFVSHDISILEDLYPRYNKRKKLRQEECSKLLVNPECANLGYSVEKILRFLREMRVLTLGSLIEECFKRVKVETILKDQDWTSIQQYESDADNIRKIRMKFYTTENAYKHCH